MKKWYWLPPLILQALAWPPVRLSFHIFCRLEIRGREHLRTLPKGSVIFAANHTNELDPILVRACLPLFGRFTPLFYTAFPSEFFKKGFGWRSFLYGSKFFLKAWGAYPVYRGMNDFEKALSHHIELLEDKRTVLIFPEGGRTKDGTIREGKPGVAFLAHHTDTPVVPIAINSTFGLTPRRFLSRKQKIVVSFGKPILLSRKSVIHYNEYKKTAQRIMNEIQALF